MKRRNGAIQAFEQATPPKLAAGLFWLAAAFTLVVALLPEPLTPLPFEAGDKVQHMLAFAVLSVLAAAAFPRRRLLELFAAMALLGGLIEVLQMIPALHRDAEVLDWVADCAASLAALVIWFAARRLVARLRGASD